MKLDDSTFQRQDELSRGHRHRFCVPFLFSSAASATIRSCCSLRPTRSFAMRRLRAFCVSRLSMPGACPGPPTYSLLAFAPTTSWMAFVQRDCS